MDGVALQYIVTNLPPAWWLQPFFYLGSSYLSVIFDRILFWLLRVLNLVWCAAMGMAQIMHECGRNGAEILSLCMNVW